MAGVFLGDAQVLCRPLPLPTTSAPRPPPPAVAEQFSLSNHLHLVPPRVSLSQVRHVQVCRGSVQVAAPPAGAVEVQGVRVFVPFSHKVKVVFPHNAGDAVEDRRLQEQLTANHEIKLFVPAESRTLGHRQQQHLQPKSSPFSHFHREGRRGVK